MRVSVWAVLAAAGRGERLGADRPKAFARLGGRPLLAESLERLEASDWVDVDRRRRSARLGGAGDPARRGARLRQGRRRASRAARRGPSRCGWAWPRSREDAAVDPRPRRGAAAAAGRGRRARCSRRSARAGTARCPALPVVDTIKRVDGGAVVETLDRATSSSPCRRRRRSSRRCCARRSPATSPARPTAPRSSRRAGGRVTVVEGDPRLLKVTTPEPTSSSSRRWLAGGVIVDYHMHLRDPRERIAHARGGRALRRDPPRAASTRSASPSTSTTSARRGAIWSLPYQTERCVYDLDDYVDAVARGEAPRPAGQARARGRLGRPTAQRASSPRCSRRTRGTTCSARCTGSTGTRSTRSRASGRRRPSRRLARATSRRSRELAAIGLVDVLSHPDLVKIFGRRPAPASRELHADRGRVAAGGVAIEISTAGLHKPRRRAVPGRGAARRCRSAASRSRSPRTRTSRSTSAATSTAPSRTRARPATRR